MNLNLFQNHLSYISNFKAYARKFQCKSCKRHTSRFDNMKRNQRACAGKTWWILLQSPDRIWYKLDQIEICVEEKDRLYEWFLVYDFESMRMPMETRSLENLEYTEQHEPISVTICSNVINYTAPFCIVDPNVDSLVEKIVTYMKVVARVASEWVREF